MGKKIIITLEVKNMGHETWLSHRQSINMQMSWNETHPVLDSMYMKA